MAEQTAVEWLVQQMADKEYILWNDKPYWLDVVNLIDQAKQMEKDQIIEGYISGTFLPLTTQELNRPEQYYNKTYGK